MSVVVALDRATRTLSAAAALAAAATAAGHEVLDQERAIEALGPAGPQPDAAALASVLAEARKPFGVGQFTERRYALAGGYLAAQVALLGWHLYARHQFNVATRGADLAPEERRRRETNLSLGLLLGAMSANVIEAVIVGYLWPALEQP